MSPSCAIISCVSVAVAAAAVAVAAVLQFVFYSPSMAILTDTGNAYAGHLVCSVMFGTPRSLDSVLSAELTFPPLRYGRQFQVNRTSGCVKTTWSVDPSDPQRHVTYCWRHDRLGCQRQVDQVDLDDKEKSQLFAIDQLPLPSDQTNLQPAPMYGNTLSANVTCLRELAASHFNETVPPFGLSLHSRALLVLHHGRIVFEHYAPEFSKDTRLHGWSMTKSMLNALIGIRIQQGMLAVDTRLGDLLPVGDILHPEAANITVKRALQMRDALDIDEVYEPLSGVTNMLFNKPALVDAVRNVGIRPGAYASSKSNRRSSREHPNNNDDFVGEPCFEYNSLTTNLLSMALRATFASHEEYLQFPTKALFEPLGMSSAMIETDSDGVFIAFSFGWATARDWARFGTLYMRDGMLATTRLLPEGWVDFSRAPAPTSKGCYGAHFWIGGSGGSGGGGGEGSSPKTVTRTERERECDAIYPSRGQTDGCGPLLSHGFPAGTLLMKGFEDQLVAVHPEREIVVVRLGATKVGGVVRWNATEFYRRLFECVPQGSRGW